MKAIHIAIYIIVLGLSGLSAQNNPPPQPYQQPQYQQPPQQQYQVPPPQPAQQPQYQQPPQQQYQVPPPQPAQQPQYQQPPQQQYQVPPQQPNTVPQQQTTVQPSVEQVPEVRNIKHIIKCEPTLLLNGDLPIHYEYFLFKRMSLEAGLGLTFRDYIRDLAFDFNDLLSKSPEGKGSEFARARLGVSFRAGVRFYPTKKAERGSGPYFAFQFQAKSYNWVSEYKSEKFSAPIEANEKRNFTDFNLIFGKQKVFKSNITIDMYGGLGVRSRTIKRYKINPSSENNATPLLDDEKTDLIPNIVAGIKLGFAF